MAGQADSFHISKSQTGNFFDNPSAFKEIKKKRLKFSFGRFNQESCRSAEAKSSSWILNLDFFTESDVFVCTQARDTRKSTHPLAHIFNSE